MTAVPESDLQRVLQQLATATSRNATARKTAARWFNRLYFDVRIWNEAFIEFLHTYPGFDDSTSGEEYKDFIHKLSECRDSLQERYGTVKGDLCTSLKILSARYPKDFRWLYEEDPILYDQIRSLIDDTYASEIGIIGIAFSVCDFIYQISSDPDWHREHHDEVVRRIEEYENSSKREVAVIRQMAEDVGIHLLDITEYEEILNNEGSANPNVMVIGEITNVNVTGPGNIVNVAKFMANVVNHVNQKVEQSGASDQVQQLVKQLTEQVNAISAQIPPEKATQMGNDLKTLSDEMALPQPRRKWYELSLDGIKEAAAALGGIGKPVVETVKMLLPLLVP